MEDACSVEFPVKAVYHLEIYWDELTFFSLQIIFGNKSIFIFGLSSKVLSQHAPLK